MGGKGTGERSSSERDDPMLRDERSLFPPWLIGASLASSSSSYPIISSRSRDRWRRVLRARYLGEGGATSVLPSSVKRIWKVLRRRRECGNVYMRDGSSLLFLSFFSSERNGGRWWGMRRSEEKNCRPCVSFRGVRQGVHVYIRIHTYARAHTLRTHVYSRVKKVVLSLCDLSGSYFVCTIA